MNVSTINDSRSGGGMGGGTNAGGGGGGDSTYGPSPLMSGGVGGGGGPNQMSTAYENFMKNTPCVTRWILMIQAGSYLLSWFFDLHYAMSNIPYFVLYRYEIYRLVTSSLFVNTSLLTLLFAFLSFLQHGKRLEHGVGSTSYAYLCFVMGFATNVIFVVVSFMEYHMLSVSAAEEAAENHNQNDNNDGDADGGSRKHLARTATVCLMRSSSGVWTILFGIIAKECSQAPRDSVRRLFLWNVPVLYYPLALYGMFVFLSAGQGLVPYGISLALGYAYGHGRLGFLFDLKHGTAQRWEQQQDAAFSIFYRLCQSAEGWIPAQAALGSDAWSAEAGMDLPTFFRQPDPTSMPSSSASSSSAAASSATATTSGATATAGGVVLGRGGGGTGNDGGGGTGGSGMHQEQAGGRTLGGGRGGGGSSAMMQRYRGAGGADARAARLEAVERRQQQQRQQQQQK